jgi:hypothetical protein
MSEPTERDPSFDDAPTVAEPQQGFGVQGPTRPPTSPQQAAPPAWQPAGWSTTGASETPGTSAPTWTPAGQANEAPPRNGRGRWIVAALVALVVVVGAVGVAVFALGSKSTASIGPTFLPASTAAYAEVRLDLPGSQRDAVVKLASHFPGFADQAAFDLKVDQTLDKWVGQAAGGAVTYSRDIKPWFGGQVALGLLELPAAMSGGAELSANLDALGSTHMLVGIGVKDRSKLDSLLLTVRALAGGTFTEEQYGDTTIVTVQGGDHPTGVYAVTDTLLLVAPTSADLKKGLDVLAGSAPALAADAGFTAAMKDLPPDRLGAYYVSPAVFQSMGSSLMGLGASATMGSTDVPDALKCLQPAPADPAKASSSGAIVAAGDHVAIEVRANGSAPQPARQVTDLAARHPADALVYLELPKVGGSIHDILACLRTAMPDAFANPQLVQIEKLLETPIEDYGTFITDVSLSASYDGNKVRWGVVAGVDNDELASKRVGSLLSYVKLAASLGGLPIAVTEQQLNGVSVTTITLSDLPASANLPIDQSISVAVSGSRLYIGGGDFAATAMGRNAADSLAGNQRFSSAVAAAGNLNGVTLYLDVDAARQRIEAAMPLPNSYAVDTQPYLKPFDRLIIGSSVAGDNTTGRILLFVK